MIAQDGYGGVENDQVRTLLAQYLEGRSEAFKNKVYELVIRFGWDVNDPSFAILLATGQMETILELFPDQFEALFRCLMEESRQVFLGHQQWFQERQGELKDHFRVLDAQQSQSIGEIERNIGLFREEIEEQRRSSTEALNKIMAIAQEKRAQLLAELKAGLIPMEQEFTLRAQAHSREVINQALTYWDKKARLEALQGGAIIGGVILVIGIAFGICLNQSFVNRFSDNAWAQYIWKWNEKNYAACVQANKRTCNFRLEPPK